MCHNSKYPLKYAMLVQKWLQLVQKCEIVLHKWLIWLIFRDLFKKLVFFLIIHFLSHITSLFSAITWKKYIIHYLWSKWPTFKSKSHMEI